MHNDVKQYFSGTNVHCWSCSHKLFQNGVVFPKARNLNGSNANMGSDVAGPFSSGSCDLFELSDW